MHVSSKPKMLIADTLFATGSMQMQFDSINTPQGEYNLNYAHNGTYPHFDDEARVSGYLTGELRMKSPIALPFSEAGIVITASDELYYVEPIPSPYEAGTSVWRSFTMLIDYIKPPSAGLPLTYKLTLQDVGSASKVDFGLELRGSRLNLQSLRVGDLKC